MFEGGGHEVTIGYVECNISGLWDIQVETSGRQLNMWF